MKRFVHYLRELMPYLPHGAGAYMIRYSIVSVLLAILDVVSLMALALTTTAVIGHQPISIPYLGTYGEKDYPTIIIAIVALILLKSGFSLIQQWFATRRFGAFELEIGSHLFEAYIGAPWVARLSRSTSQLVRMADVGVAALNAGLILPLLSLPTMVFTAGFIVLALFVSDVLTAVVTLVYLSIIAVLLYVLLSRRTLEAGEVNLFYSYRVAGLMTDMVGALKEVTLRDRFTEVSGVVRENRSHAVRARANIQFLGAVPRFILDVALIGGLILVAGISYLSTKDLNSAIGSVVFFAVAGMRLIPTLTSFQATINVLNANESQICAVIGDMHEAEEYRAMRKEAGKDLISGELHEISINNISFSYPNQARNALDSVSLSIPIGSSVGLVGESGSGKSTFVDCLLGLLEPQSGQILVNGDPIQKVLSDWRSRIGYVPQDVSLFDGTIAQNVALVWDQPIDRDKVEECLKKAQMWQAVQERPGGIDATIGERGIALSGGQRQRLGIARALYTDPEILVLDEATSALDNDTEAEISAAIQELRGDITLISIAHRLSTLKDADTIHFFDNGRLVTSGSFQEVLESNEDFARQAALAGLTKDSFSS